MISYDVLIGKPVQLDAQKSCSHIIYKGNMHRTTRAFQGLKDT